MSATTGYVRNSKLISRSVVSRLQIVCVCSVICNFGYIFSEFYLYRNVNFVLK